MIGILTLISVIAGIVGIPWFLAWFFGRKFSSLEHKLAQLCTNHNSLSNLVGIMLNILRKGKLINEDELTAITQEQMKLQQVEPIKPNPLTDEEVQNLNSVINKAKHAKHLTADEVQEFIETVEKMQDETPNSPVVWSLSNVAAFLGGMYLNLKPNGDNSDSKVAVE